MEEILQEYENHGRVYDLIEKIRPMIGRYVRDSSQNLGILIGLWKIRDNYMYVFTYAATADQYSYVGMKLAKDNLEIVDNFKWDESEILDDIPNNFPGINVFGYGNSLIK